MAILSRSLSVERMLERQGLHNQSTKKNLYCMRLSVGSERISSVTVSSSCSTSLQSTFGPEL